MVHSGINVKTRKPDPSHPRKNTNTSADVGVESMRRALWPATCSMCFGLAVGWPILALGNPEGGQAVAGSASIVQSSPSRLDVIQHSERAIIDWRKFSIDPSEHTNFQQPSASAAALNRVTGGDASSILGRLTANGQIFLVNPNGVFFGRGSQVDVAGLVATTADIRNQNFLDGRYVFDKPSDKRNALVVNQGHIEVGENGFAVLAAPHVRNEGLIQARLGRVALAGANTFTLDFEGDGLLTFDVGSDVSRTPLDEDGQPVEALVSNLGTIVANGGTVALTARAADAVIDNVINMDGVVQAQAVAVRGGEIVLSGGDSGIVEVAGDIDVSGREEGQSGGTVKVLGDKVGLFDGTHIDASGDAGGGEVLIGGNLKGAGPEPNARRTYVAPMATVKADALSEGDGGKVIVWADEATGFNGEISARGGSKSGNGGFVEVSGKKDLSFRGKVDLTVADGEAGILLLDPENITIVNGGSAPDDGELDDNQILAEDSPGATFTISEQALEALPADANVILEATNNITIEDLADNELLFASGPGGSITFTPNTEGPSDAGTFLMNAGDTIRASGRDVTISPLFIPILDMTIGSIDTSSSSTAGGTIEIGSTFTSVVTLNNDVSVGSLDSVSEFGAGGSISVGATTLTINNGIDSRGAVSSGDILLVGQEIDLPASPGSIQGTNAQLIFQPKTFNRNIVVGGIDNATPALNLTSTDLSALADGFLSIEIGSEDLGGSNGQMTVVGATFNDPVTLAANDISVDGETQTNGNLLSMTAVDVVDINADINTSGGAIEVEGNTIDTTGSFLRSLSTAGPGGDITLTAEGDITTGGQLIAYGTSQGGDIRLTSSNGTLAIGDVLAAGARVVDAGGSELFTTDEGGLIIVQANGNITANEMFSVGEVNDGAISIVSSAGSISIAEAIGAPAIVGGVGGAVKLEANGEIVTNDVSSSGVLGSGDISITSSDGAIDTTAGSIDSSSINGVGGAIALEAAGGISAGAINTTGGAGSGDISLVGEEIDLLGAAGSVRATNASLSLQPFPSDRDITIGGEEGTDALELTSADLDALADGFLRIGIGSGNAGGSEGQMNVVGASFNDSVTLRASVINVDGEMQTNGNSLLVNASSEANINADITTAGGAISIGGRTIDTRGGVLRSLSTAGPGGDIRLDAVGNVTTGDISTGGGSINISSLQGAVDTTEGALESFSDGVGGTIALEAAGDIATGLIRTRSFGAASGGGIRLEGGGAIDTTGGVVESSSSGGDGGQIALTTQGGNISTGLVISEAFGDAGTGGDITVAVNGTTGSIDTTAGDLRSSSSGADAGAVTLTTQGGNISTGVVHSRALGGTGAGGDITVTVNGATGSIDTNAGDLDASSSDGVGGAIALEAAGDIATGRIRSSSFGAASGGSIRLDSGGAIDTTGGVLDSSSPDVDGLGGVVTVEANGDIATNNILSRGPLGSGDISITSSGGLINTTAAFLDSFSTRGVGGAIALEAADGIAAGVISSTGAAGSGDIVLAGEEIDLLGSPSSVQATNASLSLQAFTSDQDISIGAVGDTNTAALDLTATDLAALADGFASITIGRNDGSGAISIDPTGISLNDPLILQSPAAGGIIDAGGPIQTTGSVGATAPTIGLQDVTTNDLQNYTGSVTFNSDYVTGGGSFTVEGDSTLASNTRVTTDGGDVLFGALEGPGELTITAGSGDILFQGDVGTQIPLGLVSVASAQNISLGGQFVAGPSEFFYDGTLTSPDPSLQVDSLSIDPDATSAKVFGSVGGASGREAALAVQGPSGDPGFTINGFIMGMEGVAVPPAEPNTNTAEEIEAAKQDVFVAEEPSELEPVEEMEYSSVEYQPLLPVRFTPKFSMSDFTMNATIKGGWPFVVDYQLERPGEVRVKIAAEGVEPFTFELDGTTTNRQLADFEVPQRFGAAVKPVSISVIALEEGSTKTVPLQLYGLGAGPKAKGSFAMDPVDFGPPLFIRAQKGETAAYRFRSQSAFDNVIVDFCSVTRTATEHIYRSVDNDPIEQGIKQKGWVGKYEPRNWDGKDTEDKISAGLHKLQVRAWDEGEEWVGAWSGGFITVADDKP